MRDLSDFMTFPFYARPYGQLQLRGTFLGMWSVLLPDPPDGEVRAAGEQVARALG